MCVHFAEGNIDYRQQLFLLIVESAAQKCLVILFLIHLCQQIDEANVFDLFY